MLIFDLNCGIGLIYAPLEIVDFLFEINLSLAPSTFSYIDYVINEISFHLINENIDIFWRFFKIFEFNSFDSFKY